MKTLFLLLLLLAGGSWCMAQSCYTDTRSQGIALYNQKKYTEAINYFEAAKDCPDKPSADDLSDWIRKCREAKQWMEQEKEEQAAKQREQAERQRLAEKRRQQAEFAERGYMDIRNVEFSNAEKGGIVINDYGTALYASDVKYLTPRIVYEGLTDVVRPVTLYIKIYDPDGSLEMGTDSPDGYTYSREVKVYPGSCSVSFAGWGSEATGAWDMGRYRYEIWYKGKKLFEKPFTLYKKSDEASYLRVDSKTALTVRFPAAGGTETFSVSTDAGSFSLWGVPIWCSTPGQFASSFILQCNANTSSSERTDYMKVMAGGREVRIDIVQAADLKRKKAKIESVWVNHNYFNGLIKGMLIHVKFTIDNMVGRQGGCTAYFYFQNGQVLKDYNSSYCTTDGQVAVGEVIKPAYESTQYSDLRLFLPYTELHINTGSGTAYLKFHVRIYDKMTNETLANSEDIGFTFN